MVFGTDGVRGVVDVDLNSKLAYDIGKGLAIFLRKRNKINKIIIGSDTRISSDMFIAAITCGLVDYGVNVEIVGIVSTPMISFFVSKKDYDAGIMITASHNDSKYNGIKIFNKLGEKLSKEEEFEVEKNIDKNIKKPKIKGKIFYINDLIDEYTNYLKNTYNLN